MILLRAAIAVATGLKKDFLLLECVPAHVSMYAHYGFVPLGDYHCRARDLDQQAIGMRLDLTGTPFTNFVAAKAQAVYLGFDDARRYSELRKVTIFTEYQGKKVYFCCRGCDQKFRADPGKYLSKLPQFQE